MKKIILIALIAQNSISTKAMQTWINILPMVTGSTGFVGMLISWHMLGKYNEIEHNLLRTEEVITYNSQHLSESLSHETELDSHRRNSNIPSLKAIANATKTSQGSPKFLFLSDEPIHSNARPAIHFAWNQPARTTPTHNDLSKNEESRLSATPSSTPHLSPNDHTIENQHAITKKAIEERIYQYQMAIQGAENYRKQFPPLETVMQRRKWAIGMGITSCVTTIASITLLILQSAI